MTRLLVTGIAWAILQLGTPRATVAAELRPGAEPSSVAPRPESPSRGALAPDRSRTDAVQTAHVTPFAPARAPRLRRALSYGAPPPDAARPGPAALPHVLPDVRAPPA